MSHVSRIIEPTAKVWLLPRLVDSSRKDKVGDESSTMEMGSGPKLSHTFKQNIYSRSVTESKYAASAFVGTITDDKLCRKLMATHVHGIFKLFKVTSLINKRLK